MQYLRQRGVLSGRQGWLLGLAALAFLCCAAEAQAQLLPQRRVFEPDPAEQTRLLAVQAFLGVYAFMLGATLGSFLNVVIYRLPRGLNIVRPRSRCPACATPISMQDNIPIVSWLALRARCRVCGVPIPPRYVLMEAAVGSLFLGLLCLEVFSGGRNLPLREPGRLADLMSLSWGQAGQLTGIALFHAALLSALLVAALIEFDRQPVPASLFRVASGIGVVFPVLWPWLRPVPAWIGAAGEVSSLRPWWSGLVDTAVGLAAGWCIGKLLSLAAGRRRNDRKAADALAWSIALVSLFLGWQAGLSVAVLTAVGLLLSAMAENALARLRVPPLMLVLLAAAVQIAFWRPLSQLAWWPGPWSSLGQIAAAAAMVPLLALAARVILIPRGSAAAANRSLV